MLQAGGATGNRWRYKLSEFVLGSGVNVHLLQITLESFWLVTELKLGIFVKCCLYAYGHGSDLTLKIIIAQSL